MRLPASGGILSGPPTWQDRPDREHFPHQRWGHDHWFLFGHVETRVVEHCGQLDWNQIAVSRRNWPMLWAARNPWTTPPAEDAADQYGLRLKGKDGRIETVKGFCEADALMDLVDEGLVTVEMPPVSRTGLSYLRPDGHALNEPSPLDPVTGRTEWVLMRWARFCLTDRGWTVAADLRKHRGNRGEFVEFSMPGELQAAGS